MHIQQRIDEQPASEIGGVAADLTAIEVEVCAELIVVEIAVHEPAEHAEHEDVALPKEVALAEIEPHLEIDYLELAIEVVAILAAEGGHALAVVAVEPVA
jgi:hypothetical protein